ncbi:MAG: hypothetical protein HY606_00950 [Planctomycetes bacterium]|nr:hypothetical protein [Planctomycetota bacterium]
MKKCLLLATIVAVFLINCQTRRLPDKWEDRNQNIVTKHFIIETDIDNQNASKVVNTLEAIYLRYCEIFGFAESTVLKKPLKTYLFKEFKDFAFFLNPRMSEEISSKLKMLEEMGIKVIDVYSPQSSGACIFGSVPKALVLYFNDQIEGTIRHELGHLFVHASGVRVSRWFNEGIAEYLRVQSKTQVQEHFDELNRLNKLDLKLFVSSDFDSLPEQYAVSWLLVYYMIDIKKSIGISDCSGYQEKIVKIVKEKTLKELISEVSQHFSSIQ